MRGLDFAVIILYFIVMIGAGVIGSMRVKSRDDYLLAGRRLNYGMFVPALAAVILGGASTLGTAKLGYKFGISGIWLVVMLGSGIIGLGLLMTSKMSNLKVLSISEMLEKRYDSKSRYISAMVMIVYTTMVAVTQVVGMGSVIASFMGWDPKISMFVGGLIVLIYSFVGGMWSITLTDVIQFWVMTFGLFVLMIPKALEAVGGFAVLSQKLPESYFSLTSIGYKTILAYFLLFFLGLLIGQDVWQRVFTARSGKVAKYGSVLAGAYSMLYALGGALVGMSAVILLPNLADPQRAFPEMALKLLSPGVSGLVLAGLLSALMSTASGTLIASTTLLVNDIYIPLVNPQANDRQLVKVSRIATFVLGLLLIAISIWLQDVLVALDVAYAILSGSVLVPVVAGFFWKRATAQATFWSIVISAAVVIAGLGIQGISSTDPIIYGIAVSLVTLVVGSFLTKPISAEQMQEWQNRLSQNQGL